MHPSLPDVVLDRLPLPEGRGHAWVVRDDLLPGGTKQRAAVPLLTELGEQGCREIVYASPFAGFAQVALAISARATGLDCVIFAERVPGSPQLPHVFSRLAAEHGATLLLADDLEDADRLARRFVTRRTRGSKARDSRQLPLGLDCPAFQVHLRDALARQVGVIERTTGPLAGSGRRVFLPVGSGTLARAFRHVLPPRTAIEAIDVGVLAATDDRVAGVGRLAGTRLRRTTERFRDPAEVEAPVPSNLHYDAKLWRWVRDEGRDGDLWWNVAR